MIPPRIRKRIVDIVETLMPQTKVTKILDWDKDRYVVIAPVDGRTDQIDPYYSINKHTSEVRPFYVGEDLLKFAKLMEESK